MTKKVQCQWCKLETEAVLHVQLFINGARNFVWRCLSCNRPAPVKGSPLYIPKGTIELHLSQNEIAALPVLMPVFYDRCAVCGSRDVEDHHWAPRAIFGEEAEKWPHDKLCGNCHDRWHLLVTPQLVKT